MQIMDMTAGYYVRRWAGTLLSVPPEKIHGGNFRKCGDSPEAGRARIYNILMMEEKQTIVGIRGAGERIKARFIQMDGFERARM